MKRKNRIFLITLMIIMLFSSVSFAAKDQFDYDQFYKDLEESQGDTSRDEATLDAGERAAAENQDGIDHNNPDPLTNGDAADGIIDGDSVDIQTADIKGANTVEEKIRVSKPAYGFTVIVEDKIGLGVKLSLAQAVNAGSNAVFGLCKAWMGFVASAVQWTLDFALVDKLNNDIMGLLQNITGTAGNVYSISDEGLAGVIWIGVSLSILLVVILFAQRQTMGALGTILKVAVVLAFISSYMILPQTFMSKAQEFTTTAGQNILKTDNSPSDNAMKTIWLIGVDQPWQQLEFGRIINSLDSGGTMYARKSSPEYKWLCTLPDDRPDAMSNNNLAAPGEAQLNAADSVGVQAARLGEVILVLILDIVIGVVFLVLAGMGVGFQIGSIMMWILGFFVLIIALFPTQGMNKIKEWCGILAMTYFGQIIVYVILLLVLNVMGWFYKGTGGDNNIFKVYAMMIGLAVGLKIMINPIRSLFSPGSLVSAGGAGIMDMTRDAKNKVTGYRGDSTESVMPNPIRMNREAKRQVQKEQKMQKYQGKVDAQRQKKAVAQEARENARRRKEVQRAAPNVSKARPNNNGASSVVKGSKGEVQTTPHKMGQVDASAKTRNEEMRAKEAYDRNSAHRTEQQVKMSKPQPVQVPNSAAKPTSASTINSPQQTPHTSSQPVPQQSYAAPQSAQKTPAKASPTARPAQKQQPQAPPQRRERKTNRTNTSPMARRKR